MILLKYYSFSGTIDQLLFRGESLFFLKQYNIIPFKTIIAYFHVEGTNAISAFRNIAGNIIGFIPFGYFVSILIFRRATAFKVIGSTFLLSLFLELIQLLFHLGTFDIDDLTLNTLGGFIGYGFYKLLTLNLFKTNEKDFQ